NSSTSSERYWYDDNKMAETDFQGYHREKDPNAMVRGASIGGVLGFLGGLAALAVPGIGPVLAAGPISPTIAAGASGAAIGGTAGTLVGLLKDEGIPKNHAEEINYHFYQGDIIIIVHTSEDRVPEVKDIFTRYNSYTIEVFH